MALILDTPSVGALTGEADLIEAARAGDDRAFEELYARYSERIRLFILGRVHDHGRAEDIAQEAFMSALRRMRATSQPIAFKPWIYEIAKNACIDEHRRARRTDEVSLDADDELISGRRALRSLGPTPPAAVESRQRLADLRGAFDGLSESHHRLLVMRELEGLPYNEIARRTGMSRQMVESSLFRARRKLAEEYDELASGRRCGEVQAMIDGGRALTARSLGIRERRRLARHLAHCQPCRLQANIAGVDKSLLKPRSVADKIAALLPFGIWRWPWRGGSGTKRAIAQTGSGAKRVVARTGAHPVTLQSVQSAASIPDPAGAASSLGGAAIAAAVIALAGAGGAIVTADAGPGHARRSPATLAPALHSTAAGRTHAKQGVSGPAHGQRSTSGAAHGGLRSTPARPRPTHSQATSTGRTQPAGSKPGSPSGTASAGGAPSAPGAASHPAKGASQGAKSAGSTVNQTGSTLRQTGSSTLNRGGSAAHHVVKTLTKTVHQTGTTVSKTASSLGKTVSGATSSLGKTVSGATSSVGKTVSGATSSLGKTVSGATSSVGKTASSTTSSVGQTASSATSSVSKTVSSTTSAASKTVSNATSTLTKAADGTVSSVASPKSSSSTASSSHTAAASAVTGTVKKVSSTVSGLLP